MRPGELDTSFCTETEIIEESVILRVEEAPRPEEALRSRAGLEEGVEEGGEDSECSEDEEDSASPHRGLRGCLRSRPCSVCLYLFLVLLLLSSFVSIIVVGLLVAAPYHRASGFLPTHCTPTHLLTDKHPHKCSCGKGCNSKYPCIRVKVTYVIQDGRHMEAFLAEDESALYRQCTYYPQCKTSKEDNARSVKQYKLQYGQPDSRFPCLYNPTHPGEVIRLRRFRLDHVVQGLVWSCVLFLLAVALITLAVRRKGCDFL